MEDLTKLDPRFVTVTRIRTALATLPLLIAAFALEGADILPFGVVLIPVVLLAAFIIFRIPLRRYAARGYAMNDDRLRVVRGLLFHSDTVVPFGRVQHIDVDQGPLERAFGLSSLTVHTAGTHNASVNLPGLATEDAVAMREEIRAHIKRETL